MDDSLENSAVLALLIRHAEAWLERAAVRHEIEEKQKRIGELDARIVDCEASFRVFGYDVRQENVWSTLIDKHRTKLAPYLKIAANAALPEDSEVARDAIPAPEQAPIHKLVLDRLKEAGEEGSKASPIRAHIEKALGRTIHEKTVGMTLYRLLQKGQARRSGHTWFYVPHSAETENPGGETPGQINPFD